MEESTEIPVNKIPQIKVQQTPPNCPAPPPCPVCPPKKKFGQTCLRIILLLIVGLILAFLILAASGLRIVRKESLLDLWLNRKATPTPEVLIEPTPTTDPTAGWETYSNTKYGYQLRYPPTWLVQSMGGEKPVEQLSEPNFRSKTDETPSESGFNMAVISNPKNLSLTDWVKQDPDNGILLLSSLEKTNGSTVIFNGLSWEKVDDESIGYVPTGYVKYGLAHNGNLYYIVIYSLDAKNIIDQVLSTFQFISITPTIIPSGAVQKTPVIIKSISLLSPTVGPLVIKGTVDPGWMFEGSFPISLLDDKRVEIATGSGKEVTPGSWQSGKPVEFSVSLTFTTKATSGFLVFKSDNPSGLAENQKTYELPIKFSQQ